MTSQNGGLNMIDWVNELFKEIIWKAVVDLYADIATWSEDQIETKLKELADEVGQEKPLSSSPVVRVIDYQKTTNPDIDHITFLVRGRIKLFKGVESVFMRVQVTISTEIDLLSGDVPIRIVDWHTLVGDLKISKKKVFNANLGFGYDNGSWSGRGALKILPPHGFGLDIYLGGLSERGAMVGLSIDLPAPIPLGSTGLGLAGMGGDFAYNFIARLEKDGLPVTDPTAEDYVRWAQNIEVLDRWEPGLIDQTSVGVGLNTDLITLADNGYVIKLEPIGLAVLTPGPVFVLGGAGKLLSTKSVCLKGYLAVDIASASLALGMGAGLRIPKPKNALDACADGFDKKEKYLIDASGTLDTFFSFKKGSLWYVNFGTEDQQIAARIITDLIRAELFFMINHYRMRFGAGISVGGKWEWWVITLVARAGAAIGAEIGWNPVLLEAWFRIWAELGLKVWKFGFILRGTAEALGHTFDPTKLDFTLKYKLDLPWPIPDITGDKTWTLGDENPVAPTISSPLLAGRSAHQGSTIIGSMELGLLHALTGRQWKLDSTSRNAWPDSEIVVPFSSRVIDRTGLVVGSVVSSPIQGGYVVNHELNTLKLADISAGTPGTPVTGVTATWQIAPSGDAARLHVLGQDPFSWLVPHTDIGQTTTETPGLTVEQRFGYRPAETFTDPKRFYELLVEPSGSSASLITDFQPTLPTRILCTHHCKLKFRTAAEEAVHVEHLILYLLVDRGQEIFVDTSEGRYGMSGVIQAVHGSLYLISVDIPFSSSVESLALNATGKEPLYIYAIRYTEERQRTCNWEPKIVLKPGKYQIDLSGTSKAEHPGGALPASDVTTWQISDQFEVDYPETLRPYIHETTIGDSRIFQDEKHAWNPTMFGFGFPIYQQYNGVVRFLVPYMDKIFPKLKCRLTYDTGETLVQDLVPSPNPASDSYLLGQSQQWIINHCGTVESDQELKLTDGFPISGPAGLSIYFDHPNGQEIKLDEWTCYVSQFDSFTDHLDWVSHCLTVFYGPTGRTTHTCCPRINSLGLSSERKTTRRRNHIDPVVIKRLKPKAKFELLRFPLLDLEYPVDISTFPDELSAPPASWRLSPLLSRWLKPLDAASSDCFARFAADTGSRFNNGGGDILNGLNNTVVETTIEAVVNGNNQPYALWLRTPEPVDWRRVTAALKIHHFKQIGDCPTGYENRHPLDMTMEILPGPDASSAFLIGSFAGHRTLLPRGEFELTLLFDTTTVDLAQLSPTLAVGSTPEKVTCKFIQPIGKRWPRPTSNVVIPAGVLEKLVLLYEINWDLLDLLMEPRIDPIELEELIKKTRPPPRPRPFESVAPDYPGGHPSISPLLDKRIEAAVQRHAMDETTLPPLDDDVFDEGGPS